MVLVILILLIFSFGCVETNGGKAIASKEIDLQKNASKETKACIILTDGMDFDSTEMVCAGTYELPNGINLSGNNITMDCRSSVIIHGTGSGTGINLTGSNNQIKSCTIENYNIGVSVVGPKNLLLYNIAKNNNIGFMSSSFENTFSRNTAQENNSIGFYLFFENNSSIRENKAENNPDGFRLHLSSGNLLLENSATNNTNTGFTVYLGSNNNTLKYNYTKGNHEGFFIDATNTYMEQNSALENTTGLKFLVSSTGTTLQKNFSCTNQTDIQCNGGTINSTNDYCTIVQGCIFSSCSSNCPDCSNPDSYLCGDVTLDGITDIADLTFLVDYLFGGGQAPVMECIGNNDGIGAVDIGDLTYLVEYLFGGGPEPICGTGTKGMSKDAYLTEKQAMKIYNDAIQKYLKSQETLIK